MADTVNTSCVLTKDMSTLFLCSCGAIVGAAVILYVYYGSPWEQDERKCKQSRSGLRNLGNTCFINSVLQALASVPEFLEWINNNSEIVKFGKLSNALSAIMKELNRLGKAEGGLETKDVINAIMSHGWVIDFRQQDAHELFQVLMSSIEEEREECSKGLISSLNDVTPSLKSPQVHLKAGSGSSHPTKSPFQGLLKSQITCLTCQSNFEPKIETFESLSLHIPNLQGSLFPNLGQVSIETCLESFTRSENISDVHCNVCAKNGHGLQTCRKAMKIQKCPKCLCVHIQRVLWSPDGRQMNKMEAHVRFEAQLNLAPFTESTSKDAIVYDLAAILVHYGEAMSGHYVTYRKLPDGKWLYTSDSETQPADRAEVLASQAYMLIYVRKNTH